MKAVFMGTPQIAATILDNLIKGGIDVAAVVTQPDRPKGRGKKVAVSEVKQVALEYNLDIYQPQKISKDEEFLNTLAEINPDIIIVAAFGQFLPEIVLRLPKYGCINVHASLLPKYRGAAPIQWAIIDNEKKTGVTIQYMEKKIDTGDIIVKEEVEITPYETGGSLSDKLAEAGSKALFEALRQIENDSVVRTPQDDNEASYVKVLAKTDGLIDFNKEAEYIERLVRGLNPWPSAYTYLDEKILKIWKAKVERLPKSYTDNVCCGTVVSIENSGIYVKTVKDCLKITELQLEGRKRMSADEFLRGFKLETGNVLGKN